MEQRTETTVTLTGDELKDIVADYLNGRADIQATFDEGNVSFGIPELAGDPSWITDLVVVAVSD